MANSYQGNNTLTGANSYTGANSLQGVNSLTGVSSNLVPEMDRPIELAKLSSDALKTQLNTGNVGSTPNSYTSKEYASANTINDYLRSLNQSAATPQQLAPAAQAAYDPNQKFYGNIDPTFAKLVGDKYGTDTQGSYVIGADPSKFQRGLGGYQQKDNGDGTYTILGASGENLGTGYYDVTTATDKLIRKNAVAGLAPSDVWERTTERDSAPWTYVPGGRSLLNRLRNAQLADEQQVSDDPNYRYTASTYNPEDGTGEEAYWSKRVSGVYDVSPFITANPWVGIKIGGRSRKPDYQPYYTTKEAAEQAIQNDVSKTATGYAWGDLTNWEMLGQALSGAKRYTAPQQWGGIPTNGGSEVISGRNTLYGSQPIFFNGRLIGYDTNLATDTPTQEQGGNDSYQMNPYGIQVSHKGKSHNWSTGLGRDLNAEGYAGLVQGLDGSRVFVPLENVDKLPGWTNKENYQHADVKQGIIQKIWENTSPTHLLLNQKFEDMQPIGAAVGNFFVPGLGSALNAVDSYSKGDSKGGNKWLGSAALSYAGGELAQNGTGGAPVETGISTTGQAANSMSGSAGGVFGSGYSLGSTAANVAAQNAALAGAGKIIGGASVQDAVKDALLSGALGMVGNSASSLMSGLSPLEKMAAQTALRSGLSGVGSTAQGGDFSEGALRSLIGSAVGGASNYVAGQVSDNPTFNTALGQFGSTVAGSQLNKELAKKKARRS